MPELHRVSIVSWKSIDHLKTLMGKPWNFHVPLSHKRMKSFSRSSLMRTYLGPSQPILKDPLRPIVWNSFWNTAIEGFPWENLPTKQRFRGAAKLDIFLSSKIMVGSASQDLRAPTNSGVGVANRPAKVFWPSIDASWSWCYFCHVLLLMEAKKERKASMGSGLLERKINHLIELVSG